MENGKWKMFTDRTNVAGRTPSPEPSHQLRAQLPLSNRRVAQQHLFYGHLSLRLDYLFLHNGDSHLELHDAGERGCQFLLERCVRRIDVLEFFLKALRD